MYEIFFFQTSKKVFSKKLVSVNALNLLNYLLILAIDTALDI